MIDWKKPIQWILARHREVCGPPELVAVLETGQAVIKYRSKGHTEGAPYTVLTVEDTTVYPLVENIPEPPKEVWAVFKDGNLWLANQSKEFAESYIERTKPTWKVGMELVRMQEVKSDAK